MLNVCTYLNVEGDQNCASWPGPQSPRIRSPGCIGFKNIYSSRFECFPLHRGYFSLSCNWNNKTFTLPFNEPLEWEKCAQTWEQLLVNTEPHLSMLGSKQLSNMCQKHYTTAPITQQPTDTAHITYKAITEEQVLKVGKRGAKVNISNLWNIWMAFWYRSHPGGCKATCFTQCLDAIDKKCFR